MNKRLKLIRNTLSLSQDAFGKKLGITGAGISKIESGDRRLTEQMLLAICREYNVNENWFRTGNGDMFQDIKKDEYTQASTQLSSDPVIRSILIQYWKLDNNYKKMFKDFICLCADNIRLQEKGLYNYHKSPDYSYVEKILPNTAAELLESYNECSEKKENKQNNDAV